jgi:hypothetical protein
MQLMAEPKAAPKTVQPEPTLPALPHRPVMVGYYANIARISALLLVALLAMTTFLLTAGLQHPKPFFTIFFYLALGSLGLNLILYAVGMLLAGDQPGNVKLAPLRYVQQGVFILSIVGLVGFAVATSMLFFGPISSGSSSSSAAAAAAAE